MKDGEIIGKVHNSMYQQIQKAGFAAPVQVLIDLGYLSASDYENWRFGRVQYLERVCRGNLRKLSFVMKQVRAYASKNNLKPSWTFYRQFGRKDKKPAIKLRFTRSGNEDIERAYATHYISPIRVDEIKSVKTKIPESDDEGAENCGLKE